MNETNYLQNWSYKDITLFSFEDFEKRCNIFFDMYFNTKEYEKIISTHYYCGDGIHSFTIYDKDMLNELFTIVQNDFAGDLYFMVYVGEYDINYDSRNEYHFQSLTKAFNFIISKL